MATALETNLLEAQPRESGTKNKARRVRRDGKIPAVVYGAGKDSLSISVDPRVVTRILNSDTGHNTIFDLALKDGERSKAMIVDWQYEPIKGKLLHIDLKRIALDKVLKVSVPIVLVGEAAGVKQEGGIMEQMLREVEIECLPGDIPTHIDADVSQLTFGKVLARFGVAALGQAQVHHGCESACGARHFGEGRSGCDPGCDSGGSGCSGRARSHQEGQAGDRRRRRRGSGSEAGEGREEGKEIAQDADRHGFTRIEEEHYVSIREYPRTSVAYGFALLEAVLKA